MSPFHKAVTFRFSGVPKSMSCSQYHPGSHQHVRLQHVSTQSSAWKLTCKSTETSRSTCLSSPSNITWCACFVMLLGWSTGSYVVSKNKTIQRDLLEWQNWDGWTRDSIGLVFCVAFMKDVKRSPSKHWMQSSANICNEKMVVENHHHPVHQEGLQLQPYRFVKDTGHHQGQRHGLFQPRQCELRRDSWVRKAVWDGSLEKLIL
jgi:hypothetical protein